MGESTGRPMPTGDELMRTAPILVWMAGADKLCIYCNEAWLDFTGRRPDECIGEGWIRDVHPDDREKVLREYVQAFDARAQFKIEYRLLHKSKKYRWIHSYGIPRFTDDGQFVGYIVSAIDVSDRKALDTLRLRMTASFSLAQEQERQRIGQELHDDIGQRLISTSINLNTIAWSVTDPELKSKLLEITEEMQVVISDLGRMSRNMRGLPVMIVGLVPALKALCDRISRKTGIQIDFRIRNLSRAIPAEASTVLFRVAQEALVNLVKHSGATHARVTLLVSRNEAIQLSISDNGIGFSTEQSGKTPGFGLISMRERARLAGGRLSIGPDMKKGRA